MMENRHEAAYVLEHGLHQSYGDLGLLDEIVFGVLYFDARGFLLGRAGVLQSAR